MTLSLLWHYLVLNAPLSPNIAPPASSPKECQQRRPIKHCSCCHLCLLCLSCLSVGQLASKELLDADLTAPRL